MILINPQVVVLQGIPDSNSLIVSGSMSFGLFVGNNEGINGQDQQEFSSGQGSTSDEPVEPETTSQLSTLTNQNANSQSSTDQSNSHDAIRESTSDEPETTSQSTPATPQNAITTAATDQTTSTTTTTTTTTRTTTTEPPFFCNYTMRMTSKDIYFAPETRNISAGSLEDCCAEATDGNWGML